MAADDTIGPPLTTQFAGQGGPLFWFSLRMGLLSILTLGIYRFWMKTRLRRWYWSAIRPGGHPLEYNGLPEEKLLGFLIGVVFLAFYIGIVNLLLMFISFSLFEGNVAAYVLSFVGVIPLWFFARYRARRYVLARTRWRGIRFGLEPGAWGYAWRAMVHWALTLITAGLLWPRMTFALEKYMTDRTFFGTARLEQGGSWIMLYRPFLHVLGPGLVLALSVLWASLHEDPPLALIAPMILAPLWLCYGIVHYTTRSFALLSTHKTCDGIRFDARPRPWRVFRIYALGYGLTALVVMIPLLPIAGLIGYAELAEGLGADVSLDPFSDTSSGLLTILSVWLYFAVFLLWSTLRSVFVTLPLMRHYSETLTLLNTAALDTIGQRDRDEFAEAEGFAEALDVGAAI